MYQKIFLTIDMFAHWPALLIYDRFYSQMTKGTFIGMARIIPEKFQFSIKVPETITHVKRLDVNKGVIIFFEEFLDKISPLRTAKKLGAILFHLPPSFTVNDFKNIERFLDKLPTADGYDYAVEFRHPSWGTHEPRSTFACIVIYSH
jgi:uncharacterized protein YecE (DUF72 family)